MDRMYIHGIVCQVFGREFSYYASQSPHCVTVSWLPQGLHDTPQLLRERLQQAIDEVQQKKEDKLLIHEPDALVLGYGLCSNGVVGLKTNDTPLVLPRTDDCIALFLGSQQRYLEAFAQYSGTYWLNNGWIESAFIPSRAMLASKRAQYAEQYGEDNADFLMEMDMQWTNHYQYCGYIQSPVYQAEENIALARDMAAYHGWNLVELAGDGRMIRQLVNGEWPEAEYLVCPPHHEIQATFDERKITAVPCVGG